MLIKTVPRLARADFTTDFYNLYLLCVLLGFNQLGLAVFYYNKRTQQGTL
jgi:hypothetical protein